MEVYVKDGAVQEAVRNFRKDLKAYKFPQQPHRAMEDMLQKYPFATKLHAVDVMESPALNGKPGPSYQSTHIRPSRRTVMETNSDPVI